MKKSHVMRKMLLVGVAAALVVYVVATLAVASTTGIVSGVVTDAVKGTKLSGVNIEVKGLNLTTVTDQNGFFVITNVPPGNYEVVASIVGYKDGSKSELSVMMDSTSKANFVLEEAVAQEKEATVSTVRTLVHPDVVPTLYVVTSKQEQMTVASTGNKYSVPTVVLSQPGVVSDNQGYPHIRGGRAQEIGYMVEGIPITEPTSNGFGTNLMTVGMSKLQILTGGYRAEYGNAISGVLNEIKKTGREVRGATVESIYGGLDFRGINAEMGATASNGLDYYVGTYLWQTDYERAFQSEGNAADTVGKFVMQSGKNDKFTLLLNQGTAAYLTPTTHTISVGGAVPETNDNGHQGYAIAGLTWSHNFSSASFLTVRPYIYNSRAIFDGLSDPYAGGNGFYSKSSADQKGLQLEYTNQASETHLVKTGVSLVDSKNRYYGYIPFMTLDMFDPSLPADPYEYSSAVNTRLMGLFVQDQIKVNDKWQADLGVRLDSMNYNKRIATDTRQSVFAPRVGFTFSPSSRNVWRMSFGKYAMFAPTSVMDRDYANPTWSDVYKKSDSVLNPERAMNIDLGFERQVSDNTLVRVTPFYRKYTDLLQAQDVIVGGAPTGATEYVSAGNAKAAGIEMFASKKLSNNWEGWMSYTRMRVRANASGYTRFDPDTMTYTDWDQRNTLSAAVAYNKGNWSHGLQLQYGSGLPWSTIDVYPVSNTNRMDGYSIVNYSVVRKLPVGSGIGSSLRLDVYNLFNSGTVTHRDLWGEPDSWVQPRFINLSVSKKF